MKVERRRQRHHSTQRALSAASAKARAIAKSRSILLRGLLAAALLSPHLSANATAPPQTAAIASESVPASLLAVPPRSWVVDTVARELDALHHKNSYLRYRMHIVDAKGDQVRDVIESRDGTVARLLYRDGKPLTAEQDKNERQRLNDMLANPDAFAKHVKNDDSGRKIADSLMRLMPDAMIYTYVPGQPQTGKNPGMTEIVIDYAPNPMFHPPTTTAAALTGLKGRAWIDAKTKQLVRMEGNIFQGINFGWGMLAHIYPGGTLILELAEAGNGRWIFTHFTERITVRALMVKTLNIKTDIDASAFQTVPEMSYQDAIHLLLNTPLPTR
ncbi:hypothetical protein [Edaphobacter aggregans]|uniref:hypothetical protein n=1 Tax=Edaphobacter aggregans TaxID=570835 RepID=UPI000553F4DF|nr:hypothetical protein [Edaphobacter aggregans]